MKEGAEEGRGAHRHVAGLRPLAGDLGLEGAQPLQRGKVVAQGGGHGLDDPLQGALAVVVPFLVHHPARQRGDLELLSNVRSREAAEIGSENKGMSQKEGAKRRQERAQEEEEEVRKKEGEQEERRGKEKSRKKEEKMRRKNEKEKKAEKGWKKGKKERREKEDKGEKKKKERYDSRAF